MRKKNCRQGLLLIALIAILAYSLLAVNAVGSRLQYIVEPAGSVAEAAADLALLAEEWAATQQTWTLNGFLQEATMRAGNQSARGRVSMCGPNTPGLTQWVLLHGRLFTGEELSSGAPVALLDEQLAFALFREVDAADGVVRHRKQLGDSTDGGAYVPLLCGLQPEALVVAAVPLPGVGAGASFSSICSLWRGGGNFIDLHKEAIGATLWARVLGFAIGAAALLKGIRWLNGRLQSALAWHHRALQRKYALQLFPQIIGITLALLLGYAAAAALAAILLDFMLQPVYAFPECVPAVPVEWGDIRATFWQVQQTAAHYRELRTPELIRLRFFGGVIRISCAAIAVLLARMPHRHDN